MSSLRGRGFRAWAVAAAILIAIGSGVGSAAILVIDDLHKDFSLMKSDSNAGPYLPRCDRPADLPESELCAQQKAADAAENSAYWAKFGICVSVGGLLALITQIGFTLSALKYAGKSADAAQKSNEMASDNSYYDMRAYFSIDKANFEIYAIEGDEKSFAVTAHIAIKNVGKTPAYIKISSTRIECSTKLAGEAFESADVDLIISPGAIYGLDTATLRAGRGICAGQWSAWMVFEYQDYRKTSRCETIVAASRYIDEAHLLGVHEMAISRHVEGDAIKSPTSARVAG